MLPGWEPAYRVLSTFAAQMSGLNAGGIDFYTIPTLGDAKIGGADVLRVDPAQVAAFVATLTSDESGTQDTSSGSPVPDATTTTPTSETSETSETSPPEAEGERPTLGMITVDVRNASTTKGLAKSVLDLLTGKGFQRGQVGDEPVRSSSTIRYAPGERNVADYTAGELGGAFAVEEDTSLSAGTLTVVLGTDYEAAGSAFTTQGLRAQPRGSTQPSSPSNSPSTPSTPAPQITAGSLNCVN